MKLALFDLDHTLIPFDSGLAWTRFLVERGVLPPKQEAVYLDYCRQYVAGTLDIHAMHRAGVAPLAGYERSVLDGWAREFEATMAARIPVAMHDLVDRHRDAGDLCAIVTATTRLVAEPFARLFGNLHLVATEAATIDGSPQGRFSGEIAGDPCFRAFKVSRVEAWLADLPGAARRLADFTASAFYSDSISDLPLLQAVTAPVAVRPDARLQAVAQARGWPVLM